MIATGPSKSSIATCPDKCGGDPGHLAGVESRMPAETPALPPDVGVGFKLRHLEDALAAPGPVTWLEVHAENYMVDGGPRMAALRRVAERFAISCHGVGLSIGSDEPLDREHLDRLAGLVNRFAPAMVSEHLAWSRHGHHCFNDLLPVAYDEVALNRVCGHVDEVQERLGRRILIENPANYLIWASSTLEETAFLEEMARRTGCGLLLDLNNVHVSAVNLGFDARDWLESFPLSAAAEIHLAGHHEDRDDDGSRLLIDSHGAAVVDDVLALYGDVCARTGPLPTLIEWDSDVPPWSTLVAEASRAGAILEAARRHD